MATTTEKRFNKILGVIDDRLVPNAEAKKARGEVFTPLNLVREILFGLKKSSLEKYKDKQWPAIKSNEFYTMIWGIDSEGKFIDENEDNRLGGIPLDIWRDEKSTFLDPANGIGNFPVVAYYMLDYQLGKHGPASLRGEENKKKRRKHIIENMLFMIEINKGNCNTTRKIFKEIAPDAEPNICCNDTLKITKKKLDISFGRNTFTVVMGNPPFNENLSGNPTGHAQDTGLWEKFVNLSLQLFLKREKGNYLVFLHPARWRQPDHPLHNIMFGSNIHFLSIYNKKTGDKYFGATTRFDYYILENIKNYSDTYIKFEDNNVEKIRLSETIPFISNFGMNIWIKLLKIDLPNINVLGGGSTIKYSKDDHAVNDKCPAGKPNKNVNTTAKTSKVPKGSSYVKTRKNTHNGKTIFLDVVCSSNKHNLLDKKKVIFSKNEVIFAFYDKGEYGLTSNAFCILVDSESDGNKLVKFLHSNLLKYLIASVKFGNFSTAKNIFEYIPNPLSMSDYTEEKFDTLLNLTKDEKQSINGLKEEEGEETACGSYTPKNKTRKIRKAKD